MKQVHPGALDAALPSDRGTLEVDDHDFIFDQSGNAQAYVKKNAGLLIDMQIREFDVGIPLFVER